MDSRFDSKEDSVSVDVFGVTLHLAEATANHRDLLLLQEWLLGPGTVPHLSIEMIKTDSVGLSHGALRVARCPNLHQASYLSWLQDDHNITST